MYFNIQIQSHFSYLIWRWMVACTITNKNTIFIFIFASPMYRYTYFQTHVGCTWAWGLFFKWKILFPLFRLHCISPFSLTPENKTKESAHAPPTQPCGLSALQPLYCATGFPHSRASRSCLYPSLPFGGAEAPNKVPCGTQRERERGWSGNISCGFTATLMCYEMGAECALQGKRRYRRLQSSAL